MDLFVCYCPFSSPHHLFSWTNLFLYFLLHLHFCMRFQPITQMVGAAIQCMGCQLLTYWLINMHSDAKKGK